MNYDIKQFYVVKAGEPLLTSGTTTDLAAGQVGIFNGNFAALVAAPTPIASPYIFIAQGTGIPSRGSFKTPKIYLNNITSWYGDHADMTEKEQITYVGWDEINDCKTPTIRCEKDYTLIIRVWEHYLLAIYQPYLQEGVVVKAPCCSDCGTDCDDLGAFDVFTQMAASINANPRVSPYVTASVVSKLVFGTAIDPTFCLTMPDPGTSAGNITDFTFVTTAAGLTNGTYVGVATTTVTGTGSGATFTVTVAGGVVTTIVLVNDGTGYEIGDTTKIVGTSITGGTTPADDILFTITDNDSDEGLLLASIRTFYTAQVADPETDIVFSTDLDSSTSDVDAIGNVMIVMTPLPGVVLADIENFNGLAWEECACVVPDDAVYEVGLKLVGNTPDGFTNFCMPDAVPYIANRVRFKVFAGEAPGGSQLEDLPNFCDLWFVTTTQEIKFPVGDGYAIAEIERWTKGNDVAGAAAKRYWINYFNDDTIPYFVDTALLYDIYYLKYLNPMAGAGFEHATNEPLEIAIAVPSTMVAWKAAFEAVMNPYVLNSPAYFPPVVL